MSFKRAHSTMQTLQLPLPLYGSLWYCSLIGQSEGHRGTGTLKEYENTLL